MLFLGRILLSKFPSPSFLKTCIIDCLKVGGILPNLSKALIASIIAKIIVSGNFLRTLPRTSLGSRASLFSVCYITLSTILVVMNDSFFLVRLSAGGYLPGPGLD